MTSHTAARTVVHVAVTYRRAGTEQIVIDLVAAAVERGWVAVVIVPALPALDGFAEEIKSVGGHAERVGPLFESSRKPLRNLRHIYRILRRHRADVVHFHYPWAPTCYEAIIAAWLARAPVRIRTEHNPIVNQLSLGQRLKMRVLDRLVTRIVCVSIGNRSGHVMNGKRPPYKISVIPNGIHVSPLPPDLVSIREALVAELSADPRHQLVAMIGALEERKGVLDFVRMVSLVPADVPATYLVVGDGPLSDDAARLASELAVQDRVRFLGRRNDVRTLLHAVDIFVQPSHYEGLSIAMLEALAAGKPMVTTAVDGVADVTARGVLSMVNPVGHIEGLARDVTRLIANPELRRRLSSDSSALILMHFSAERMCSSYLEVYESLLGASRSYRAFGRLPGGCGS